MKLTSTVWALLPAAIQATFKKVGDTDEYDNGEEDVTGLKSALQKEKLEKAEFGAKLSTFEAAKKAEIEAERKKAIEEARTSGDFATIEKDYQKRLADMEKTVRDSEKKIKEDADRAHLSGEIDKVTSVFLAPAAMKDYVSKRLTVETLSDGTRITRVLDAAGKPTGLGLEDLKKEFLTSVDLKPILAGSKGSGGGSTRPTDGGGSTSVVDNEKFDAVKASPAEMIARLEAKGVVGDGDD